MKRLLGGLLCVLLCGAAVAAGDGDIAGMQASMLLSGKISVAPDGSVSGYSIDQAAGLPRAVTDLLAEDIPRWRFEPTLHDGVPVTAQAQMDLRLVAKPIKDKRGQYALSIAGTHFGSDLPGETITYRSRLPIPAYPALAARALMAGTVYLLVRVGQDGKVQDAVAEQVNLTASGDVHQEEHWRSLFAQASVKAARQWTFNLPTTGPYVHAEYWVARIPVNFNLKALDDILYNEYGHWKLYLPGPRQPVPWFDQAQMISGDVDAVPDGGIYPVDHGLHLAKPSGGA